MGTDSEETKAAIDKCICKECPSWAECGEKGAFCQASIGRSKCIKAERGCICGACPVTRMMGLKHVYYCTRGT
jgi:hypothetical protein